MIEISYVLTIDDVTDGGTEAYVSDSSTRRYRLQWVAIGLGLIAIVVSQPPSPFYWLVLLGLFFIWCGLRPPKRYLKSHFQKSVTGEQIVARIDEMGVSTESPTAHGVTKWEGIVRTTETRNTFSLITNNYSIYVFPKRVFSEQSLKEFQQLIVQKGISKQSR
jgi:hypothetical protein